MFLGERKDFRLQETCHDPDGIEQTKTGYCICRLQGIGKKMVVVIDTGETGTGQEVFTKNLMPEVVHSLYLTEKTVPPHIKAETLMLNGPADPPHHAVRFKTGGRNLASCKVIGGCKARRPAADDYNGFSVFHSVSERLYFLNQCSIFTSHQRLFLCKGSTACYHKNVIVRIDMQYYIKYI